MSSRLVLIATTALLGAHGALAAEPPDKDKDVVVHRKVLHLAHGAGPGAPDHALAFVAAHGAFEARLVKGAPYAAEAVTETAQALADGNRIVRKTSAAVARDSEGRTRREHALGSLGPLVAGGDSPRIVFIHDPVAGVHYALDLEERTARKMALPAPHGAGAGDGPHAVRRMAEDVVVHGAPGPASGMVGQGPAVQVRTLGRKLDLPEAVEEPLGKQVIEGVEVEGTRSSVTIPVGRIGNERPIEIVTERWYSPELQAVVMSRHRDPRFGETTYRLTSLVRGEPDRSLFEVPADFTVEESPAGAVFRFKKKIEKKKQ